MVDRITPATTDADLHEIEAMLGVRDAAAVVTEPFWQWVIQDRFAGARPPLEVAGVQVVDDVGPFERAKLRLLNAAHSTLAYVGLLCGFAFVHEAVGWPPLSRLVQRLWDEAEGTLVATPGLDLAAYRARLLRRFDNPSLAHRLDQIARDGSRKLPQRLLAPLAERSGQGRASPAMVCALAAWLACVESRADSVDPCLGGLRAALRASSDGFAAMAAVGMIPNGDWIDPACRAALAGARMRLAAIGPRAATAEAAA
jgi:fructuronate reductase